MRKQWIARLLANPLLDIQSVLEQFAPGWLRQATAHGHTRVLSMDQTDLGDRFAFLMLNTRAGNRALPSLWSVEDGAVTLGVEA